MCQVGKLPTVNTYGNERVFYYGRVKEGREFIFCLVSEYYDSSLRDPLNIIKGSLNLHKNSRTLDTDFLIGRLSGTEVLPSLLTH